MAERQGVLIVGEMADGHLSQSSKELLAHGRKVADALGESLSTALLGEHLGENWKEAVAFGADKVYAISDPLLKEYQPDAYLVCLTRLAQDHPPRVILLAKSDMAVEVGPRLAFRLNTGLAQDCMEISLDDERRLIGKRPVFGGNCMAIVACSTEPMMATIRAKTADPLERDDSRQGEVESITPGLDPSVIQNTLLQRVEEAGESLRLNDAAVVVAGGRGLGGPEPFSNELQELAKLLGAAVGASRAAVDHGWIPYTYQIGLTGKTITPDLYIAIGISGASQHMAGCSGAKVIVAINRDSEASIFKAAKLGVVGEWEKVLPAFIRQLKELL